jgi:hypothetical protein
LWDLAAAQADSGDASGALATWKRIHALGPGTPGTGMPDVDIERLGALVAAWPADKPLPEFPGLFVLTPQDPAVKLALDDPATRKRAYQLAPSPNSPTDHYAFAAGPGQELATLEFACDVEQLRTLRGGQLVCAVLSDDPLPTEARLANLEWDKEPGRAVVRVKADVPPGRRVVRITTGTWKGNFSVHGIDVTATFRPVTPNPPPLAGGARLHVTTLPAGATLMCGDQAIQDGMSSDLSPGEYAVSYKSPGSTREFQTRLTLRPGARCGIFANLASPFQWKQTPLDGMSDIHIVPLPDGRFLAVGESAQRIMLAVSTDRLSWSEPKPAPFDSVFINFSSAAVAAADGTVYVAFFSNRLTLEESSTGGFRLLITSTRDGKMWTALRPIEIPAVGGWPLPAPCLLQRADKTCLVLWGRSAATGKSFDEIRALQPIETDPDGPKDLSLCHPQVLEDAGGKLHLVFDDFGRGIYYARSEDALHWDAPRLLVKRANANQFDLSTPQLILGAGKPLLIYGTFAGQYLAMVDLAGDPIQAGGGLKITGPPPPILIFQGLKLSSLVAPLAGSRACLTADGDLLLPAGQWGVTWILRASWADLQAAVAPTAK